MTDPSPTRGAAEPPRPSHGAGLVRNLLLGAAFAATFVAGGLTLRGPLAAAQEMAMSSAAAGDHGGMHAMARAHVEHMLAEVDATADQKTRVEAVFQALHAQMAPVHARFADSHKAFARLLTAPVIDRAALEQLRAARMADLDRASRALTGAVADAAEVLTPAQRAKLAAAMNQHAHPGM